MGALKDQFCGSAMHVFDGVKARDVKDLWDLLSEYTQRCERLPDQQRIGYIMKNLGYQSIPTSANYWYLGNGVKYQINLLANYSNFHF
jgi:predicted transcriptional regulator of viral defense system